MERSTNHVAKSFSIFSSLLCTNTLSNALILTVCCLLERKTRIFYLCFLARSRTLHLECMLNCLLSKILAKILPRLSSFAEIFHIQSVSAKLRHVDVPNGKHCNLVSSEPIQNLLCVFSTLTVVTDQSLKVKRATKKRKQKLPRLFLGCPKRQFFGGYHTTLMHLCYRFRKNPPTRFFSFSLTGITGERIKFPVHFSSPCHELVKNFGNLADRVLKKKSSKSVFCCLSVIFSQKKTNKKRPLLLTFFTQLTLALWSAKTARVKKSRKWSERCTFVAQRILVKAF